MTKASVFTMLFCEIVWDDHSPYHQMLKKLDDIEADYYCKTPNWDEQIKFKMETEAQDEFKDISDLLSGIKSSRNQDQNLLDLLSKMYDTKLSLNDNGLYIDQFEDISARIKNALTILQIATINSSKVILISSVLLNSLAP